MLEMHAPKNAYIVGKLHDLKLLWTEFFYAIKPKTGISINMHFDDDTCKMYVNDI